MRTYVTAVTCACASFLACLLVFNVLGIEGDAHQCMPDVQVKLKLELALIGLASAGLLCGLRVLRKGAAHG